MKYLVILWMLMLASIISYAQVSVYDCSVSSPNVPLVALEASEPGSFHKPCVLLDELNSYNFSGDQELHITADQTIHIKEDFHSGQYTSNGNMHLEIKPQEDLDVLLMSYPDLYNVERFGKLELAVVLPQNIEDAVADFVANGQSGTNVNPFDPEQLEIKAYFSPLYNGNWQYPWIRHGFYYEAYEHTADTLSWQEVPTAGSKFRIRFAPRATGLWRCAISVSCPVTGQYWDLNEFQFTVIDTGKPDFVRIGENGRYFKIGGDPFYTWGMNMPTQGRLTAYNSIGTKPKDYNLYFEQLRELKSAGGNYFRYMNQPYSTEIEFEHLGDYSDRMFRAWEMDRVIDSLETLDMRMHWCLSYNLPLTYTGIYQQYFWDWSAQGESGIICDSVPNGFGGDIGYCYHSDPNYGVETVDSFFTDPDLIRYYQNRLRYYISRYGYSTRIGTFEFMNEINFSGISFEIDSVDCSIRTPSLGGWETKPYFYDTSYVKAVSNWQGEMARYIKEDLEHSDHLLTVCYGGPPNEEQASSYDFTQTGEEEEGISWQAGDESYNHVYVDVRGINDYEKYPEKWKFAIGEQYAIRQEYGLNNDKPFFYPEIGNGHHYCDQMHTYQQLYIMSPFLGAAGAGLPWEYNNSDGLWDSIPERYKGWSSIPKMKQFLSGIDFNHDNWLPDYFMSSNKNSQVVYLRNQQYDSQKAIGIINNNTVNRYSMREATWCDTLDSNGDVPCDCWIDINDPNIGFPTEWEQQVEIGPVGPGNELRIGGLEAFRQFEVEYFNVSTGVLTKNESNWSNGLGYVNLDYPTLSSTFEASNGNSNGSMVLVKVRRSNISNFRTADSTNNFKGNDYIFDLRLDQQKKKEEKAKADSENSNSLNPIRHNGISGQNEPSLFLIPNPTNGLTTASIRNIKGDSMGAWKITDAYGKVIWNKVLKSQEVQFESQNWNAGIYFVTWTTDDHHLTGKLIVK